MCGGCNCVDTEDKLKQTAEKNSHSENCGCTDTVAKKEEKFNGACHCGQKKQGE